MSFIITHFLDPPKPFKFDADNDEPNTLQLSWIVR